IEEWKSIPKEIYQNLINSMPSRIQAVISANGIKLTIPLNFNSKQEITDNLIYEPYIYKISNEESGNETPQIADSQNKTTNFINMMKIYY
ncbi:4379_t:CDS:2, partial [Funneliformis caledonium]